MFLPFLRYLCSRPTVRDPEYANEQAVGTIIEVRLRQVGIRESGVDTATGLPQTLSVLDGGGARSSV